LRKINSGNNAKILSVILKLNRIVAAEECDLPACRQAQGCSAELQMSLTLLNGIYKPLI